MNKENVSVLLTNEDRFAAACDARIERGVEYLNQKASPDWFLKVSIRHLDMHSCVKCVLGRVIAPEFAESFDACKHEESVELGFSIPRGLVNTDQAWHILTERWKQKLEDLREARRKAKRAALKLKKG